MQEVPCAVPDHSPGPAQRSRATLRPPLRASGPQPACQLRAMGAPNYPAWEPVHKWAEPVPLPLEVV